MQGKPALSAFGALQQRTESVAGWRRRRAERTRTRNRPRRGRERAELLNSGERLPETSPIKGSPGAGLAAGRNVGVPDDIADRISPWQTAEKFRQALVLPTEESSVVAAS